MEAQDFIYQLLPVQDTSREESFEWVDSQFDALGEVIADVEIEEYGFS